MCDVNGIDLDNQGIKFKYLSFDYMLHIAINGIDETRKQYSVHSVINAVYDVNLGHEKYRLLHSTQPDVLHVIQKGIIKWSMREVIENLPDKTKVKLDNLAINFHATYPQKYCTTFPKTSFPSGFTTLC